MGKKISQRHIFWRVVFEVDVERRAGRVVRLLEWGLFTLLWFALLLLAFVWFERILLVVSLRVRAVLCVFVSKRSWVVFVFFRTLFVVRAVVCCCGFARARKGFF
jgi:hypothetical protein